MTNVNGTVGVPLVRNALPCGFPKAVNLHLLRTATQYRAQLVRTGCSELFVEVGGRKEKTISTSTVSQTYEQMYKYQLQYNWHVVQIPSTNCRLYPSVWFTCLAGDSHLTFQTDSSDRNTKSEVEVVIHLALRVNHIIKTCTKLA